MSDRVTIVLTLKNRSAFTDRWMRYMNDCRCPYPILIADGGDDSGVESRLRDPGNYPHLRYDYRRYPLDADYEMHYRKLADAIERVETPYVLLADNDDFLLLDPVPQFCEFLDRHDEAVSCGGRRFVLRLQSVSGDLAASATAARYEARADQRPKSVRGATAADRMVYFLSNVLPLYLWSSWYAVHRTPALASATGYARQHRFRDPVTHEAHIHLALLMRGGYEQLEVPSIVIQAGSSQLTAALEARGNLIERFVATNAFADLHASLDSFGTALSDNDRERIFRAMAVWIAAQARKVSPVPQAQPTTRLPRMFGAPPRDVARLPAIEPYILD